MARSQSLFQAIVSSLSLIIIHQSPSMQNTEESAWKQDWWPPYNSEGLPEMHTPSLKIPPLFRICKLRCYLNVRNLFGKVPVNSRDNQLFQKILSGNKLSCSFVSANSWEAIILIYDNAKSAEFKTTESREW